MDTDPSANGPERPREIRASETPSLAALALAIQAQKQLGTGFVLRLDTPASLAEQTPEQLLRIDTRAAAGGIWRAGRELIEAVRGFPFPVVALLEEGASDAWLEVALACSSRVAIDRRGARLRLDYRAVGLAPWLSGLWHAAARGGVRCARDLTLGSGLSLSQALTAGLIDAIVPPSFDTGSLSLNSPVVRSNHSSQFLSERANAVVKLERARLASVRASDDGRAERMIRLLEQTKHGYDAYLRAEQTAFADLILSSHTQGRLLHGCSAGDAAPKPSRLKIAIVGATTDSVRLAARLAQRHDVVLMLEPCAQLASAAIVVEASRGSMQARRASIAAIQAHRGDDGLLAVSARDGRISDFPPATLELIVVRDLLEITCTMEAQRPQLTELAAGTGPSVIMRDGPGRFGARLQRALKDEVSALLAEGVSGGDILHALVDWGFELELCRSLVPAPPPTSHTPNLPSPYPGEPLQQELLQARCALVLVNEACRCVEDGTVRSVADADRAAVAAIGFPTFRVGPFHYARSIGVQEIHRRLLQCERRLGPRFSPAPALMSSWT